MWTLRHIFEMFFTLVSNLYSSTGQCNNFHILPWYINKIASDHKAGESGEPLVNLIFFLHNCEPSLVQVMLLS